VQDESSFDVYLPHSNGPLPVGYELAQQFTRLRKKDVIISVSGADSCLAIVGSGPVLVRNIMSNEQ